MTVLNTTFFYHPTIERELHGLLVEHWLPLLRSYGEGEPVCLAMKADDGVGRLAVQMSFASTAEVEAFEATSAPGVLSMLTERFGPEAMTAFSTIMQRVELCGIK